jgi:hypothetical protein
MAREPIAPPFRTSLDAALYCLTVAAILLLPLVLRALHAPSHRTRLATVPLTAGGTSFLPQQVFDETSDIDMLIVGDSVDWVALDALEIQKALSKSTGRDARVVSLGWFWTGEDMLYYVLRDVLAHRKVGHVVLRLFPEDQSRQASHAQAWRWLFGCEHDAVIPTLRLTDKLQAYGVQAIGGPRNLLSLVRPDRLSASWESPYLGHFGVMQGWPDGPLRSIDVPVPQFSLDALMVDAANASQRMRPVALPLRGFQQHYAVAVRDLLRSHGVPVTLLRVPKRSEVREHTLTVSAGQLALYGDDAHLVVPDPGRLFAQLSDADLDGFYYYDERHLNRNGSHYFTLAEMPALIKIQQELHAR